MKKKCGNCEHIDHSVIYAGNPPQYKCEYYGCLVSADDECKCRRTMCRRQDEKDEGE